MVVLSKVIRMQCIPLNFQILASVLNVDYNTQKVQELRKAP